MSKMSIVTYNKHGYTVEPANDNKIMKQLGFNKDEKETIFKIIELFESFIVDKGNVIVYLDSVEKTEKLVSEVKEKLFKNKKSCLILKK